MNPQRIRTEDFNYPPAASPRFPLRRMVSRRLAEDDLDSTTRNVGEPDSGQPWIESLWQRVRDSSPSTGFRREGCTIFKVPGEMRRQSPRLYSPSIVPIGPYHCGYGAPRARDSQFADAQGFKWSCLAHLLRRQLHVDPRDSLERCVEEMRALEPKTRGCYARPVEMDENEYVEMLLLDSCFILYLILHHRKFSLSSPLRSSIQSDNNDDNDDDDDFSVEEEEKGPSLPKSPWVRNRILHDLLLLENQIPFFVVQHLFFLVRTPREANVSLLNQTLDLFANLHPGRNPKFVVNPSMKVHHLLHLFYLSILPSKKDGDRAEEEGEVSILSAAKARKARKMIMKKRRKVKRREEGKDDSFSFMDVRFHNGVIEVPCLQLWDYSYMLFSNLVAFEQCYGNASGEVMGYVAFMDMVVNCGGKGRKKSEVGDVEGVFVNMQRGDKNVAGFFEGLCAHVSMDCADGYMMELLEEGSRPKALPWKDRGAAMPATAVAVVLLVILVLVQVLFLGFVSSN